VRVRGQSWIAHRPGGAKEEKTFWNDPVFMVWMRFFFMLLLSGHREESVCYFLTSTMRAPGHKKI